MFGLQKPKRSKRSDRANGAKGKKVLTGSRGKGGGALIDHTIRKEGRRGEEGRKVNEGKKTGWDELGVAGWDGGVAVGLYEVIHRIYEGPRAGRWVLQQA